MIKFKCSNCGQGFTVSEEYAGKRATCPKCKNPVVAPGVPREGPDEQNQLIKFHCPHCNQKIGLAAKYAGKTVHCAKCKNPIKVPLVKQSEQPKPQVQNEILKDLPAAAGSQEGIWGGIADIEMLGKVENNPIKLEQPPERTDENDGYKISLAEPLPIRQELNVPLFVTEEDEPVSKRKLLWPIDIFLYPASVSGIITIGCLVIGQTFIPIWLISLILSFYTYWFFCECIRDSSSGGLRAPEVVGKMESLSEMFSQCLNLFACFCFFFGPVSFYVGYLFFTASDPESLKPNNIVFYSLLTYGIFFFPIGVLAVVLFDSINGLNPILLIRSILSAFFQYCGLVLLFYCVYFLFYFLMRGSAIIGMKTASSILGMFVYSILSRIIFLWMLFIAGHLLGRFYWRNEERLCWEV